MTKYSSYSSDCIPNHRKIGKKALSSGFRCETKVRVGWGRGGSLKMIAANARNSCDRAARPGRKLGRKHLRGKAWRSAASAERIVPEGRRGTWPRRGGDSSGMSRERAQCSPVPGDTDVPIVIATLLLVNRGRGQRILPIEGYERIF